MALVRVRRPEVEEPIDSPTASKPTRSARYVKQKKNAKKRLLRQKWKEDKKKYRASKKEARTSAISQLNAPQPKSSISKLFMSHPHSVATIMNYIKSRGRMDDDKQTSKTTETAVLRVFGYPTVFKTPAQIIIAGPTKTGKSTLVTKILQNKDTMFDRQFDEITYYAQNGNAVNDIREMLPFVNFREGQPDWNALRQANSRIHRLIILDDMQSIINGGSYKDIEQLFTVNSHHNNISIIFIVHDNYQKRMITLRRNADYLIFTTGGNVIQQIKTSATQLFNSSRAGMNAVKEAIDDITSRTPYGYIVMIANNTVDGWRRITTNIFPGQRNTYYIPAGTREVPSLVQAKEIARRQIQDGYTPTNRAQGEEENAKEPVLESHRSGRPETSIQEHGGGPGPLLARRSARKHHATPYASVAKKQK